MNGSFHLGKEEIESSKNQNRVKSGDSIKRKTTVCR